MLNAYNGHSGEKRERVQRLLNKRWASGEWTRPARCVACGQTSGALHGHLEDYDVPESYVALCVTCHLLLHMRFRHRAVWDEYRSKVRNGWRAPALEQRSALWVLQKTIVKGEWPPGSWEGLMVEATYLDVGPQHP